MYNYKGYLPTSQQNSRSVQSDDEGAHDLCVFLKTLPGESVKINTLALWTQLFFFQLEVTLMKDGNKQMQKHWLFWLFYCKFLFDHVHNHNPLKSTDKSAAREWIEKE